MLTFKSFLQHQPDSITDIEARDLYQDYKTSFKKSKIEEFFLEHSSEEWLMNKYHPLSVQRINESTEKVKKHRSKLFWSQYEEVQSLSLEVTGQDSVLAFLEKMGRCLEEPKEDLSSTEALCRQVVMDLVSTILEHVSQERNNNLVKDGIKEKGFKWSKDSEPARRLPAANSIYLRKVPVSVSSKDLEDLLQNTGFLRLSMSDPTEDSGYKTRKAWITFEQKVNIKDVCLFLGEMELNGQFLGAVVNKELSKKVRVADSSPLLFHAEVVRSHIKVASKMITHLDEKWNLAEDGGLSLLDNIEDYLVEVVSAEEDELLGVKDENHTDEVRLDVNQDLLSYLDKLLVYLRLVHSIDFYNMMAYPNEDQMPHKLGMIHIRGPRPKPETKVTRAEVEQFILSHCNKLKKFHEPAALLSKEESMALGWKDEEEEVENFINRNTQEVKSGKFLCPLSGKKFRGEDFVRKHILSRYGDRVEEVRNNTRYFNNYVQDPNRPLLMPKPVSRTQSKPRLESNWNMSDYNPTVPPPRYRDHPHQEDHQRQLRGPARYLRAALNPDYNRPRVNYNDMDIFKSYDY